VVAQMECPHVPTKRTASARRPGWGWRAALVAHCHRKRWVARTMVAAFVAGVGGLSLNVVRPQDGAASTTVWTSTTAPTATLPGASGGDELGSSVAISSDGTTAVVGAINAASGDGAAYVYHVASSGDWSSDPAPIAVLTNSGNTADDQFGYSVAISPDGTTTFVGAQDANSSQGAVYVFHVDAEDSWASTPTPTATLTNAAGGANNNFGSAISLSSDGTTAVIGSPLSTNSNKGAAYVFHVADEDSWVSSSAPTATLTDSASATGDNFGESVAISGDGSTAVVGTYVGSGPGYADVFNVSNEGSWATTSTPTGSLADPTPQTGVRFGFSVSLSADGTMALIGAPGSNSGIGAAYVFGVPDEDSWAAPATVAATLTNATETNNENFGASVTLAADGTTALIGAAHGVASVFQAPNESSWATSATPAATLLNGSGGFSDYFGLALGLSSNGTTALVGAAGVDSDAGAAYVFEAGANTPPPAPPSAHGYWLVGSDGGIFSFGSAVFHGSTGSLKLQRPVVGITPTADNGGYWLAASDGGVFAFDAGFFGSIPGLGLHPAGSGLPQSLNAPIVGIVPSSDGEGYFMVASDGGVFAFGDAKFEGSCPGIGACAGQAVAVMPDASGNGYWVVTSTGNVYAFGDAHYYGAPSPQSVPVTSGVRTPDGGGYWILFGNGAVAGYGDAVGSNGPLNGTNGFNPATAIFAARGGGYWIATATGGVFAYSGAPLYGSMSGTKLNAPIISAIGF
jgi:hypothetical protein